jgi:putative FmdB family regulatory protein
LKIGSQEIFRWKVVFFRADIKFVAIRAPGASPAGGLAQIPGGSGAQYNARLFGARRAADFPGGHPAMPIYAYQCQDCGHDLEAIQKVSDPLLVDCPACKGQGLRKKLTAGAFRLSGGGWYETDFKTGDRKRNLAGEPPAAAPDAPPKADGGAAKPAGAAGAASPSAATS